MFSHDKPIIGMIHLAPLAGSPRYHGAFSSVVERALSDALALEAGGVEGMMLENFGDAPFFSESVPPGVIAQMTAIASEIRRKVNLPLGINVLRNDAQAAICIAQASGAQFIRVNVLTGARLTDQGIIQGKAAEVLRLRKSLGAEAVSIFADVQVKHSVSLVNRPLDAEIKETLGRGGADGIIVTGSATGIHTNLDLVREAKNMAGQSPLWVGSGTTKENIKTLSQWADGFIVGTSIKREGLTTNEIDVSRVRELVKARG